MIRIDAPIDNFFADLETGMIVGKVRFSGLNGNSFAYVGKCFVVNQIQHSTISNNTASGWKLSTGTAPIGAFCHVVQYPGCHRLEQLTLEASQMLGLHALLQLATTGIGKETHVSFVDAPN